MTRKLVFLEDVRDDVDVAYAWYEQQRSGLGEAFLSALQAALDDISRHAEAYAVVYRSTRARLTVRFPFVIYYRIREEIVEIVAVLHGRRSAEVWRKRVRGR